MLSKIKTLATTGAIASGLLRRRKNPDVSKDLESSNVASTQETRERIADDVEKITRTRVPSESELAGFEGTYADFAGSREYATKLSALLKGNYRGRLKYHEKKLSQKFFSLLSSDPNELAAGLRLLTDLLMDVQDSHFHTERTGIKFRADIFDDWYFSILSRYGSLDVEKRKEARANLRRLYENEMRSPFVSRDRPVRGLAGSLLFSFSEFEGRPDTAFVTLGSEGERFSGFGLRITSKNAKTLFS